MIGPIIEVFNHAPWPLSAIKDGQDHTIPSGFSHMRSDVLPYARNQNVVPGTADTSNPSRYESLVSYVAPTLTAEERAEFTVWPEEVLLALKGTERIDRATLGPGLNSKDVKSIRTSFPRGRVSVESPTQGMLEPGKFD